jgi:hypothetical protein
MKYLFAAPILFASALVFAGVVTPVMELNAEIAKILAPFQNEKTEANLVFDTVETDAIRALNVKLAAKYKKVGSANQFDLEISNLSYQYGDGTTPTTNLAGSLKLDLTKFVSQDDLNGLIPGIEELLLDAAKNFTQEYGEAVNVVVNISEKNQDGAGNYTGIAGTLAFNVDLSKLPEGKLAEDVPVLSGNLALRLQVTEGATFSGSVISNPGYKGFQQDNDGLKEILDRLLAKDAGTLDQFRSLFEQIEELAKQVVGE